MKEGQILNPCTTFLLCSLFYVFAGTQGAAVLPLVLISCTFKYYRTLEGCKLSESLLDAVDQSYCATQYEGFVSVNCLDQ